MTSNVALRAFAGRNGPPFATLADRQKYPSRLWWLAGAKPGTDAALAASAAGCPRNEMIFERVVPSCYLRQPFPASLEQKTSASRAPDEMPAEDMHRAVLKISQVYTEIRETAEHIVASSPREVDHGKKADGMSAGG